MLLKELYFLLFIFFEVLILNLSIVDNTKQTCIISMSIGYRENNSIVFFKSLVDTNFSGIVIIFSDKKVNLQHGKNIVLYSFIINKSWPFIRNESRLYKTYKKCMLPDNIVKYRWAIYRYGLYYCFIKEYYSYFSNIFLLDLRDTIFQKNPQNIIIGNSIYLCEDASYPYTIKDNLYDKKWLSPFNNSTNKLFDEVPLNGGSIYGNSLQIKKFLKQFIFYLKEYYTITSDQGVLNFIYYTHKIEDINVKINHNNNGSVYNMAVEIKDRNFFSKKPYFINQNRIYRLDYTLPHIIHQYDREKKFKNYIFKYYS